MSLKTAQEETKNDGDVRASIEDGKSSRWRHGEYEWTNNEEDSAAKDGRTRKTAAATDGYARKKTLILCSAGLLYRCPSSPPSVQRRTV